MAKKVKRTKAAIKSDGSKKAKKPGKRKSASGASYYESRVNRSDTNRKKKPYL